MAANAAIMQTVVQIAGSLDPSLAASLQSAQKGLSGINKASLIAKAGLAAIGTAAVKFGKDSLSTFKGFDDSMRQVQATMNITAETDAEAVKKLSDAAKEAGKATKFSASQGADALNYLALAGYDVDKAVATLPKVLNLAAAGNMDLAYTSDLVTDSMSALGVGVEGLDTFMDQMTRASQKSNTSIAQLGEAYLKVGGTAKDLAGGTAELATVMGLLGDNGTKESEAGTSLRNILLSLTPTTDCRLHQL